MLYIIRHGMTDWNERRKLQGRTDIPLNDKGRKMAKQAAIDCADIPFDICYCSPLVRARETAEILLEGREIPIVNDERLVEMGYGIYEGIEKSFDIPDCPINSLFYTPESYKAVEDGESLEELFKRTGEFLKELVYPALDRGLNVLIVGHGAMNCSIFCQVKGIPVKDFWSAGIENCKLMRLL